MKKMSEPLIPDMNGGAVWCQALASRKIPCIRPSVWCRQLQEVSGATFQLYMTVGWKKEQLIEYKLSFVILVLPALKYS
jgi:hypothetical protein